MAIEKTSKAVIKTARLNPINQPERIALEHIAELEKQGFNFKQIIVDAINHRAGATPEMFSREPDMQEMRFARMVEDIVGQFAKELMDKIQSGTIKVSGDPQEDEKQADGISAFTQNFARSLLQRQQMTSGDDVDD